MKAIETRYKGYRFRSRLEARWAVFFDALGVKWEFEREGFRFCNGKQYLPDFWLPEYRLFVEVKPFAPLPGEEEKAVELLQGSGAPVFITQGDPLEWGTLVFSYTANGGEYNVFAYRAMLDLACNAIRVALPAGEIQTISHDHVTITGKSRMPKRWLGRYEHAVYVARSARFEFGESGAPA